MMTVTEAFVDSIALNAAAAKNGRDLVKKNSFAELNRSEDGTLLFGACKGSGKEPYRCSADFVKPESPVYRCSCPSRQFPCKHVLGLLYAFAQGRAFEAAAVPDEIADKREKAEKREEKREEKRQAEAEGAADGAAPRKKTNKAALAKKLAAQLEGVELASKVVLQIAQGGIASVDAAMARLLEQQIKQLGSYYVPGLAASAESLVRLLRRTDGRDAIYTEAIHQLTALHALLKRSADYLNARLADPERGPDAATVLEERIGHAWQLAELREHGRASADAELAQLAFYSYADEARGEYVDEGYWVSLQDGVVVRTLTYRPFRAAKHIKEEDSFFQVAAAKELFTYPGGLNPRVRWEASTMRELSAGDRGRIASYALPAVNEALKIVKNELKNPLAVKRPALLLRASRLTAAYEGGYALEDGRGGRLALDDLGGGLPPTTPLLELLGPVQLSDVAVLVLFGHDLDTGRLTAQPLSIVTEQEIVRLAY
ncbi:SWIM zinc finger family protein [Paenibacillus xanthanilyticus]|uniref:SWIM zinc finger family protein n=1 Tax=Paenibacillus xanthanilyticus TaxID=1783531 RepID=A0ABV8K4C1_9BACL